MIRMTHGDVTLSPEPAILHGCNAQGVMGSGVAKAIRQKFPKAYEAYRKQWEVDNRFGQPHMTMGSIVPVQTEGKLIVNAITQLNYGQDGKKYVSYDAVDDALQYTARLLEAHEFPSIAMPKIGAGLGGGRWAVISDIIEHRLANFEVWVYEFNG